MRCKALISLFVFAACSNAGWTFASSSYEDLVKESSRALNANKADDALTSAEQAIAINDQSYRAYRLAGLASWNLRYFDRSSYYFEKAGSASDVPDNEKSSCKNMAHLTGLLVEGRKAESNKQLGKAARIYSEVSELLPNSSVISLQAAKLWLSLGEAELAGPLLQRAKSARGGDDNESKTERAEAMALLQEILPQLTERHDALVQEALALCRSNPKNAIRLFEHATTILPDRRETAIYLAATRILQDENDAAALILLNQITAKSNLPPNELLRLLGKILTEPGVKTWMKRDVAKAFMSDHYGPFVTTALLADRIPLGETNSIGMQFAWIEPGEFKMGSGPDEEGRNADNEEQHTVRLTRPFLIGVHHVTAGEFQHFVADAFPKLERIEVHDLPGPNPQGYPLGDSSELSRETGSNAAFRHGTTWRDYSYAGSKSNFDHPDNPAMGVTWGEAAQFCEWLSKKEGRRYRLPTEAEYEYVCRAGSSAKYPWGTDYAGVWEWSPLGDSADRKLFSKVKKSVPPGVSEPNAWGVKDMIGNGSEWCSDIFAPYEKKMADVDPTGPSSTAVSKIDANRRVIRGGGFTIKRDSGRAAWRSAQTSEERNFEIGFRCVVDLR